MNWFKKHLNWTLVIISISTLLLILTLEIVDRLVIYYFHYALPIWQYYNIIAATIMLPAITWFIYQTIKKKRLNNG